MSLNTWFHSETGFVSNVTTTYAGSVSGLSVRSQAYTYVTGYTQNLTGGTSTSAGTTGTVTASYSYSAPANTQSFSYPYTSTTNTSTATASFSTTQTFSSAVITSSTTSFTETTTGTPTSTTYSTNTTATVSTSTTGNTSTSGTSTITLTTNTTTSVTGTVIFDTVVWAASTDWGWVVTTTGTAGVTSVGASFTQTTISNVETASSVPLFTYNVTAPATASTTFTSVSAFTSATATTAAITTSSSTYSVAAIPTTTSSSGASTFTTTVTAALPLTSSSIASITFTTTTAATLTFESAATHVLTYNGLLPGQLTTSTISNTILTTFSGGTIFSTFTYTVPYTLNGVATGTQPFSIGVSSTGSGTSQYLNGTLTLTYSHSTYNSGNPGNSVIGATYASANPYSIYSAVAQTSSTATLTIFYSITSSTVVTGTFQSNPTFTDYTQGPGWQPTPSSFGLDEPIGTNVGGPTAITAQALGYPGVSVAVVPSTTTATLAGSLTTSQANEFSTSVFGGFGWNSSMSTTATDTQGIVRMTTCDSSTNTSTTEVTFATSNSTYTLAPGQGIAAESVPMVHSQSTNFSNSTILPYLNFPAFPNS